MLQSADPEVASSETEGLLRLGEMPTEPSALSLRAAELARGLPWVPGQHPSRPFWSRCRSLCRALKPLLARLESPPPKAVSDDFRWLHDNTHLLESELADVRDA